MTDTPRTPIAEIVDNLRSQGLYDLSEYTLDEAADLIESQEAELLRLRGMEQDAKRYRFVRIPGQLFRLIRLMAENRWNTSDQLDTAIDKALAATQCARTEAEQ